MAKKKTSSDKKAPAKKAATKKAPAKKAKPNTDTAPPPPGPPGLVSR